MKSFKAILREASARQDFIENDDPNYENVGYHYGDLGFGWDTTMKHMSGGRGTGHFGTGTYFLGKPLVSGGFYGSRPQHRVDFAPYKLARPRDPKNVHDAFKIINGLAKNDESLEGEMFGKIQWMGPVGTASFNLYMAGIGRGYIKTEKELEALIIDEINKERNGEAPDDNLTVPTRIMQRLGYDGIDVRGTKFDNVDYGSVIFATA